MAFTEFTCRSGGSNLYAGSLDGSAEASTTPLVTYTNGAWVSGTGVFTPVTGNPVSAGVAVGNWASVYTDGASAPTGFVGRVTAVSVATITVSITAKSGTVPTTGATGITLVVGGAWLGPNGTVGFPFNFAAGTLTNTTGSPPRINFKNGSTYSITAAMSQTTLGPIYWQGYATAFGDGGRATFDGGTSGSSYVPLTVSSSGVAYNVFTDLIFQNNGASGSSAMVNGTADGRSLYFRCVFANSRGAGLLNGDNVIECETYGCNQSNTVNTAGFTVNGGNFVYRFVRCNAHDNTGGNTSGFYTQVTGALFVNCVADTNGLHGFFVNNVAGWQFLGCDTYNNGGDGIRQATLSGPGTITNCNFVKNGGYGINVAGIGVNGYVLNCGFGSGTAANTSGATNGTGGMEIVSSVTYASNLTPWVDPANGDFRINLAAAEGTGRGNFTETAPSYTGTVGYPDIGAAQHQDTGGVGGMLYVPGMTGGMEG